MLIITIRFMLPVQKINDGKIYNPPRLLPVQKINDGKIYNPPGPYGKNDFLVVITTSLTQKCSSTGSVRSTISHMHWVLQSCHAHFDIFIVNGKIQSANKDKGCSRLKQLQKKCRRTNTSLFRDIAVASWGMLSSVTVSEIL